MSEITVVCLADSVSLYDIGVFLFRGDRAKVKAHLAKGSKDFAEAKTRGLIAVSSVKVTNTRTMAEAGVVNRAADSPRVAMEPPMPRPVSLSVPTVPAATPPVVVPGLSEVNSKLDAIIAEMKSMREERANPLAPPTQTVQVQPVVTKIAPQAREESPVEFFIPSNLVQPSNGRVDVKTDADKNTSALDAASAILKAKKRGNK